MMEVSSPFTRSHKCMDSKYDIDIYVQLMNTWNGLPSQYWEKILGTVWAELNAQIHDIGVNSAPCEPINTRGISYNRAAMEALLGEPEVEHLNFVRVDILEASLIYFDTKGRVGIENTEEGEEAAPPV